TGTVAFKSSALTGLNLKYFLNPGMADIFFAIFCKNNSIPMVSIARHENWVTEHRHSGPSLFKQFRDCDPLQTRLLKDSGPWGYASIKNTIQSCFTKGTSVNERLRNLLPPLDACMR